MSHIKLRSIPTFEKYPEEIINQAVDFSAVLDTGEVISTASVTAKELISGSDVSTYVINGSPTILTQSSVSYQVKGGTSSISYILDVVATLDSTEVYSQRIRMDVVEIPPE